VKSGVGKDGEAEGGGKRKGRRGKRGEKRAEKRREGELRVGFWNVAKVRGKEFWERIKDVVGLVETWMEEGDWEKWKGKVSSDIIWTIQGAKREEKKGRARGGIWTGVRKDRR